jgi:hypothetical protein
MARLALKLGFHLVRATKDELLEAIKNEDNSHFTVTATETSIKTALKDPRIQAVLGKIAFE